MGRLPMQEVTEEKILPFALQAVGQEEQCPSSRAPQVLQWDNVTSAQEIAPGIRTESYPTKSVLLSWW